MIAVFCIVLIVLVCTPPRGNMPAETALLLNAIWGAVLVGVAWAAAYAAAHGA